MAECGECGNPKADKEDYLCKICRMITDGENFSALPKHYYTRRCEYCGKDHTSVNEGRFLGLCYACKDLATRSIPLLEDDPDLLWEKFDAELGHHQPSYDQGFESGLSEGLDEGLAQGRREARVEEKK